MKENLSVTLNIHGTLSAQGIHEPLSHQLHSIYTLTDADSSQQDHNNQCQQYGNDTVCIPVVAEGVDRTTIRATHWTMPLKDWRMAMSRFIIEFGDRLDGHF